VSLQGFEHRQVRIRGRVYDGRGTALRGPDVPRITQTTIDSGSASVELIFVPGLAKLTAARETFVRFEMFGSGALLAVVDTPPLVRGVPPKSSIGTGR
jgi:hypothetical protein